MTLPLSPKEIKFLHFIENHIRENGFSPSYQEICDHFHFASFNSVQNYLKQLIRKNYLKMEANQKRAIQLLYPLNESPLRFMKNQKAETASPSKGSRTTKLLQKRPSVSGILSLPLLGAVAAGQPLESYRHEETVDVPASMVKSPTKSYILKVEGESMIDEGICNGDYLLVFDSPVAANGDLVVAKIQDEATVKRIYFHKNEVELRPSNSTMASMWYPAKDVAIRGLVQGLIRHY